MRASKAVYNPEFRWQIAAAHSILMTMTTTGLILFDTAIGRCGVVWGQHGLLGVQLPEASDAATKARLRAKTVNAPDAEPHAHVTRAIEAMINLLEDGVSDLSFIGVDMAAVPDFNRSVYDIARTIDPGETLTYGDIANRLGDKMLARAIGKALGENPFPIVIPCHRVLAANGKTGGFSANGGVTTKFKMLQIERAKIGNETSDAPMLFEPQLSVAPGRR